MLNTGFYFKNSCYIIIIKEILTFLNIYNLFLANLWFKIKSINFRTENDDFSKEDRSSGSVQIQFQLRTGPRPVPDRASEKMRGTRTVHCRVKIAGPRGVRTIQWQPQKVLTADRRQRNRLSPEARVLLITARVVEHVSMFQTRKFIHQAKKFTGWMRNLGKEGDWLNFRLIIRIHLNFRYYKMSRKENLFTEERLNFRSLYCSVT